MRGMSRSHFYGVIAQDITMADDKSWVAFNLRPEAKWADASPLPPKM